MNPDQLGEAITELTDLLNGVVQGIPEAADLTVSELVEYLALAKTNRLQLLTIHKTLPSAKPNPSRRTA